MSQRSLGSPRGAPLRVVVIDDDDFEREFLVDLLQTAGFDASGTGSVFGVTNHLAHENVDVVVLDVMMPSIRGDKLAVLLRKSSALSKLGVVLVSSLPEEEVSALTLQVNADAFVAKANVRAELAITVASVGSK